MSNEKETTQAAEAGDQSAETTAQGEAAQAATSTEQPAGQAKAE